MEGILTTTFQALATLVDEDIIPSTIDLRLNIRGITATLNQEHHHRDIVGQEADAGGAVDAGSTASELMRIELPDLTLLHSEKRLAGQHFVSLRLRVQGDAHVRAPSMHGLVERVLQAGAGVFADAEPKLKGLLAERDLQDAEISRLRNQLAVQSLHLFELRLAAQHEALREVRQARCDAQVRSNQVDAQCATDELHDGLAQERLGLLPVGASLGCTRPSPFESPERKALRLVGYLGQHDDRTD